MVWLQFMSSAVLFFWAMVLVSVSFNIEDSRIFWVQRALAFVLTLGAVGLLYAFS